VDKIVKDFNSVILRKRSIVFGIIAALFAVYACSSSYDFIDDELTEKSSAFMSGDRVEGTRNVNGKTIHTAIGGTIADYVDLGIMVGGKKVLFATHNLGASNENEIGARIAWGELGSMEEGYLRGMKYKEGEAHYGFDNLKYCEAGRFSKYSDNENRTLESCDDAATVNWGSEWRMPTKNEMLALLMSEDLDHEYTRNGMIITSKVVGYQGNSIFLPYMEGATPGIYENNDGYAYYWTSEVGDSETSEAVVIENEGASWICGSHKDSKCLGNVIRPVRVMD
jgi:hypothetical protein